MFRSLDYQGLHDAHFMLLAELVNDFPVGGTGYVIDSEKYSMRQCNSTNYIVILIYFVKVMCEALHCCICIRN